MGADFGAEMVEMLDLVCSLITCLNLLDVEDDVGREAEVTCFKADFGTPGNIMGILWVACHP